MDTGAVTLYVFLFLFMGNNLSPVAITSISYIQAHFMLQLHYFYPYNSMHIFIEFDEGKVTLYTGPTRLIRSHSSARFYFELSGNSNYIIHCNSNYVQNFELEINSI